MVNYLYYIQSIDEKYLYIGITNNIRRRESQHFTSSHNKDLRDLISKYSAEYFQLTVVETSEDRLYIEQLEIECIEKYKDHAEIILLNKARGGSGSNGVKGEAHFNSILLEEDVLDIRYRYSNGIAKGRDLALEYGVSYKEISKIVRGERWSHVGGNITTTVPRVFKAANKRKLSDDEVVDLRETYYFIYKNMGPLKMQTLEEIYGIARQNLRKILTGDSYRHLPGPIIGRDYGS